MPSEGKNALSMPLECTQIFTVCMVPGMNLEISQLQCKFSWEEKEHVHATMLIRSSQHN